MIVKIYCYPFFDGVEKTVEPVVLKLENDEAVENYCLREIGRGVFYQVDARDSFGRLIVNLMVSRSGYRNGKKLEL